MGLITSIEPISQNDSTVQTKWRVSRAPDRSFIQLSMIWSLFQSKDDKLKDEIKIAHRCFFLICQLLFGQLRLNLINEIENV